MAATFIVVAMLAAAGLRVTTVRSLPVTLRAPSIDDYVTTEVESTPLVSRISDEIYRRIREDARLPCQPFLANLPMTRAHSLCGLSRV